MWETGLAGKQLPGTGGLGMVEALHQRHRPAVYISRGDMKLEETPHTKTSTGERVRSSRADVPRDEELQSSRTLREQGPF